ncbi:MAG: transcription antitermination factor NusB [Pseudomonadota bacterium]
MTPRRNAVGRPSSGNSHAASKPGLTARQVATKLLSAVVDRKTSLDGLLDLENGNQAFRALDTADQALVRAMLQATLRHLPIIEAVLAKLVDRPLPQGARALHHVLHVAAAQILYLDVPDHASVDLAVEQASGDPRNRRFAALVNAVLRRLIREKQKLLPAIESKVRNAPAWFADRLEAAYGSEAANILATHAIPPAMDLTVKSAPQEWADRLGGILLPTGTVRLKSWPGPIQELPGFAEGDWWVQDAAASIPARLFGDISGKNVADLCAAPGGKTAQLANAGARVTAVDLSRNRLRRLSENLHRLGLEAEQVEANGLDWQPDASFDAVLLDAPCSSTGTVRRHPDIPWTKGPADIEKLAALQERLLRHAITLVRPGGTIVFSNCSLDPIEGEDMVARILETRR